MMMIKAEAREFHLDQVIEDLWLAKMWTTHAAAIVPRPDVARPSSSKRRTRPFMRPRPGAETGWSGKWWEIMKLSVIANSYGAYIGRRGRLEPAPDESLVAILILCRMR
jgi:hypothetical protein